MITNISNESNTKIFDGLKLWFSGLVEDIKPDLIVGIVRGAIRILQLEGFEGTFKEIPIISNQALPFLTDDEICKKKILIFDDSIIFGSTLDEVRKYLLDRGAIVFCAAYVVDRESFFGERKEDDNRLPVSSIYCGINLDFERKLWSDEIKKHHYSLIKALLGSGADYNFDFPTIVLKLEDFDAHDIPFIIHSFSETSFIREIVDVTTPLSSTNNIYRYTAFLETFDKTIFTNNKITWLPESKLRMSFIPERNELRIKPLPLLVMEDGLNIDDVCFCDSKIQTLWSELSMPVSSDRYYHQAIFRLATFVTALVLGKYALDAFMRSLKSNFFIFSNDLEIEDIGISLGRENARKLLDIWDYLQLQSNCIGIDWAEMPVAYPDLEMDLELKSKFSELWKTHEQLRPHPTEKPSEIFDKVFRTLYLTTDSNEDRLRNPSFNRLEVGLTFENLRQILRDTDISLSHDMLSAALDVCVDYGQAVPKVLRQGPVWVRSFYSGEANFGSLIQLKESLHRAYANYLKEKKYPPLSEYDFHKLCSSIKELLPWLPISTVFNTFGRFATVEITSGRHKNLIDWLISGYNAPFSIKKDQRSELFLNPDYKSDSRSVWPDEDEISFYDAFEYLAFAFSTSNDDSIKLLISTCRNHLCTFESIATEAHSWVFDRKTDGFESILSLAQNSTNDASSIEKLMESIYWCVIFLGEARKKHTLFYRKFDSTSKRLMGALSDLGGHGHRFWEYRIKNLLDPSKDEQISKLFEFLMSFIRQMQLLTGYLVKVLLETKVFSNKAFLDLLARRHKSLGVPLLSLPEFEWLKIDQPSTYFADAYNANLRKLNSSILKTKLSSLYQTETDRNQLFQLNIKNCFECFFEISQLMTDYFPAHSAPEGGFNYAPIGKVRVRSDGSTVRDVNDIFILVMDIIGSTNNPIAVEMKDFVINKLHEFEEKDIHYEKTGNDEFLVCCFDPKVLWEIAGILMAKGESLKRPGNPFGGLRKALSKGNISIVTDSHRTIMIRDNIPPHDLPKAFYLLEAYKQKSRLEALGKDKHNAVIVIEEELAKELNTSFKLKIEKQSHIRLRAKHFDGYFYYFEK